MQSELHQNVRLLHLKGLLAGQAWKTPWSMGCSNCRVPGPTERGARRTEVDTRKRKLLKLSKQTTTIGPLKQIKIGAIDHIPLLNPHSPLRYRLSKAASAGENLNKPQTTEDVWGSAGRAIA